MDTNINKEENAVVSDVTFTKVIATTALSTIKYLFVFVPLLITIMCLIFPMQSMAIYLQFGNYQKVLELTDIAIANADEGSDEYAQLLSNAVNVSSYILTDEKGSDGEYAAACQLYDYASDYLSISDDTRTSYSASVDEYYLASTSKVLHPSIYNYEGYVNKLQAMSSFYMDNTKEISAYSDYVSSGSGEINSDIIQLMRLNCYFDCEQSRLGISLSTTTEPLSDKDFSGLNNEVVESLADDMAESITKLSELSSIEYLQGLYVLSISTQNLSYVSKIIDGISDSTQEKCDENLTIELSTGEEIELDSYYNKLLNIYAN